MNSTTVQVWIVTLHFGRGHSESLTFYNKADAQECLRIAVFANEDCINCSIYREDRKLPDSLVKLRKTLEMTNKILAKM